MNSNDILPKAVVVIELEGGWLDVIDTEEGTDPKDVEDTDIDKCEEGDAIHPFIFIDGWMLKS